MTALPSIYGLFDKDGLLRYVGKANNPAQRLKGHIRDSLKKNTPLYAWMRKHGVPEMRVLEANCVDWKEAERRLIREARERGDKLLNVADGGDQPFCPVEVRRENGRKSIARFLNGTNTKGEDSREALIRDTYNWVRMFAKTRGLPALLERIEQKMRDRFAEDPRSYKAWRTV